MGQVDHYLYLHSSSGLVSAFNFEESFRKLAKTLIMLHIIIYAVQRYDFITFYRAMHVVQSAVLLS